MNPIFQSIHKNKAFGLNNCIRSLFNKESFRIVGIYDNSLNYSNISQRLDFDRISQQISESVDTDIFVISRSSQSLLKYSTQTLRNICPKIEKIDTNYLYERQLVICIDYDTATSDFLYFVYPLTNQIYFQAGIAQFSEKIIHVYKEIKADNIHLAQESLDNCDEEFHFFTQEFLQLEIYRESKNHLKANDLLNRLDQEYPNNRFVKNLILDHIAKSHSDNKQKELDIIIYDNIFPSLHCSFTTCEFNAYLEAFENCRIITSGINFPKESEYSNLIKDYSNEYPGNHNRIEELSAQSNFNSKVIYTLFLENAYILLPIAESLGLSLVFTLYSGGHFCLNDQGSDAKLKTIFSSPCFKKVIVVQEPIRKYLIANKLIPGDKLEFIFGPISNTEHLLNNRQKKVLFPREKQSFDIAFVAYRHTPRGEDKGYDTFIETAKLLLKESEDFQFHVIGNFDENVIPLDDNLRMHFTFYGTQTMSFFPKFYSTIDCLLSPCRPNELHRGAIDGAPNVSAIEAGLCGTAVFITDQLKQNIKYKWGEEIIEIFDDPTKTASIIMKYFKNPDLLYSISKKGQFAFSHACSYKEQLLPRVNVLKKIMHEISA